MYNFVGGAIVKNQFVGDADLVELFNGWTKAIGAIPPATLMFSVMARLIIVTTMCSGFCSQSTIKLRREA